MNKILVTGGKGQLGSELRIISASYPQYVFTFIDLNELDLSKSQAIQAYFAQNTFDVVINCAAYTAVDKAESEVELTDLINHQAVATIAKIAKEKKTTLIHISTDYVFDGKNFRPYEESDPTNPVSVYGKTKCASENAILSIALENSVIIRTSWVYSSFGSNFVKTMLRLGKEREALNVIFDQVGTPTYARDLAQVILEILPQIANQVPVIYHYSNEGVASWYDFAKTIFEISGIGCNLNPITTEQYPTPAVRPHYSLLNKGKIKKDFGVKIPYWKDSLKKCLQELT